MVNDEVQKVTKTTGIVTEGVLKGFLLVGPPILLVSITVGAAIWLARMGTKLGGID